MHKLLYILLLFLPVSLHAQEVVREVDSLSVRADSVLSVLKVHEVHDQVMDAPKLITSVTDSLKMHQKIDSLRELASGIDTLRLSRALDSLQQLQLPTEIYEAKKDSLQQALDYSAKLKQEIQTLQRELNTPLQGGRDKLQKEINKMTSRPEGMNEEALGTLKEQTGVNISTDLPQIEGVSLKEIDLPANALPEVKGIEVPELSLESLERTQLPQINGIEPEKLTEKIETVGNLSEEVNRAGEYTEDLNTIAEGKLNQAKEVDQLAEQQLMQREEAAYFKEQTAGVKQPAEEFLKYRNEDHLKQKAVEEAPKAAVDHFAGQKDKLNAARSKLNKYKGRYQEVKSIKELPKNPLKRNPLKGKPWPERWVIGSIWQFHKQDQFKIDLGPSLAYRLSDKVEIGAAYQWRLTVDKEAPLFLSTQDWLSGYSLFADYKIKKGFFIRGTAARLSLLPPMEPTREEGQSKAWVNSYKLGAGKSYTFFKSLKGYSVIQYSFSNGVDKPLENPLELKIGFYMNGKSLFKARPKRMEE